MATIKREATIEDLYHAPDDGRYELIHGEVVPLGATDDDSSYVAGEIFTSLRLYGRARGRGRAHTDGVSYTVSLPHRQSFSPDASFSLVRSGRKFVDGAPIFAAEVRSAGDYGPRAERTYAKKRQDYFATGTQVVWDVDPDNRTVTSYIVGQDTPLVFREGDIAHAEPALPGWSIAVDALFEELGDARDG